LQQVEEPDSETTSATGYASHDEGDVTGQCGEGNERFRCNLDFDDEKHRKEGHPDQQTMYK
jgi:hypothetical protein